MSGGLTKRSVSVSGHRTSVALEPAFWDALETLASARGQSLNGLIATIDAARSAENDPPGLASALRVAALKSARSGELVDATSDSPDDSATEA